MSKIYGEWNSSSEITQNLDALWGAQELSEHLNHNMGEWNYSSESTQNLDALCNASELSKHVKKCTGISRVWN